MCGGCMSLQLFDCILSEAKRAKARAPSAGGIAAVYTVSDNIPDPYCPPFGCQDGGQYSAWSHNLGLMVFRNRRPLNYGLKTLSCQDEQIKNAEVSYHVESTASMAVEGKGKPAVMATNIVSSTRIHQRCPALTTTTLSSINLHQQNGQMSSSLVSSTRLRAKPVLASGISSSPSKRKECCSLLLGGIESSAMLETIPKSSGEMNNKMRKSSSQTEIKAFVIKSHQTKESNLACPSRLRSDSAFKSETISPSSGLDPSVSLTATSPNRDSNTISQVKVVKTPVQSQYQLNESEVEASDVSSKQLQFNLPKSVSTDPMKDLTSVRFINY